MARHPKGYSHRYELVRRPVKFNENVTKDWWCIVHYYGRGQGAGSRILDGDPGVNIPDNLLIKRAHLDDVTVPVYVIRGELRSDPYFGRHYGQK